MCYICIMCSYFYSFFNKSVHGASSDGCKKYKRSASASAFSIKLN